jgi:hypothetical protein
MELTPLASPLPGLKHIITKCLGLKPQATRTWLLRNPGKIPQSNQWVISAAITNRLTRTVQQDLNVFETGGTSEANAYRGA